MAQIKVEVTNDGVENAEEFLENEKAKRDGS